MLAKIGLEKYVSEQNGFLKDSFGFLAGFLAMGLYHCWVALLVPDVRVLRF